MRWLLGCLVLFAACKASSGASTGTGTGTGAGTGSAMRIASLSPSNSEILYAVGCGDRVVLRDRATNYPAAATKLPATDPFHLSPTHVAGYRPSLVLLSHADAARVAVLRRVGLAVHTFDPRTLDQVFDSIVAIGKLCGAAKPARALVATLRARVAAVQKRVAGRPRPRVYIEIDGSDPARPWVAGKGSFVDDLLRRAGGRNALTQLGKPYAQVNAETAALSKPDVILLPAAPGHEGRMRARLRQRPGWSKLAAVANGKVIDTISRDVLSRPGPRLVEGLEALARALHGEGLR
ncbi:MAG: ABC transporter substrate-binding protein [Myxococcales bacterium]|nr:ABC transporter substrate-binding protein [Myxococcales bacterium]